MNIELIDENSFFNKELDKIVSLNIKYTLKNDICIFAIYSGETIFVIQGMFNTSEFLMKLVEHLSVSVERIYLYDAKNFFKLLYNNKIPLKPILYKNIIDVRICLYDFYNKKVSLHDEIISKLTNHTIKDVDHFKFVQENSGLRTKLYCVLPEHKLRSIVIDELVCIHRLIYFIDQNCSLKYVNTIKNACVSYTIVESENIKIDTNKAEDVKKHFIDYNHEKFAKVHYDFDHASTGRIASSFHTLKKEDRDVIIPVFDQIMTIDFKCFELKVLFNHFGILDKSDDIYENFALENNIDRDLAKSSLLSYMYGSQSIDSKISNVIEEKYLLRSKLENFISKLDKNEYTTKYGKKLVYHSRDDMKKKIVNNIIQSTGQNFLYIFINVLLSNMMKLKSRVIATVYDEIILDVVENEVDEIRAIISKILTMIAFSSSFVNFTVNTKIGLNLRDTKCLK